jgi:hypothetical protein
MSIITDVLRLKACYNRHIVFGQGSFEPKQKRVQSPIRWFSLRRVLLASQVSFVNQGNPYMTQLEDIVLPLIRTRSDVSRWNIANEHGEQMLEAIKVLEDAAVIEDPVDVYVVTHKALTAAIKIIAKSDDSSGIIGSACGRLLDLHPKVAARAHVPIAQLIEWMIAFQFHGEVDYFELDPVAYAPALTETGVRQYRARLNDIAETLGPNPTEAQRWSSDDAHAWWVFESNARRLAVYDRDVEAIIRTHARDQTVAAFLEDTARAFEEIEDINRAIEWAKRGCDLSYGHQSVSAADYWCRLLLEHRPREVLDARLEVFRRWPTSAHAGALYAAAGPRWEQLRAEVTLSLLERPVDAVTFALSSLKDAELAWNWAHAVQLRDDHLWARVVSAYESIDGLAVLSVLARLVEKELLSADVRNYQLAAHKLKKMRQLAADSPRAGEVDALVMKLREIYFRRPRLQQEFDRAGLP